MNTMRLLMLTLLVASVWGCSEGHVVYGQLQHDRLLLTATANELITEVAVQKGQQVQAGDVLLQLDNTSQLQRVAQAEAELQQRQAALDLLNQGARTEQRAAAAARRDSAKARLADAEQQYRRALQLKRQNLLAQASLDQAKASRDTARAALEDASQQLAELTNGNRAEQIRQAQAALSAGQALVAIEQKRLADLVIRATRPGRIDDLPYQQGERAPLGAVLAIVQPTGTAYGRLYVPEPLLASLKVGQTVPLHADGYAATLTGTIRHIQQQSVFTPYYALNQEDRAQLMYLVEVTVPADADLLPNGLPLQWVQP